MSAGKWRRRSFRYSEQSPTETYIFRDTETGCFGFKVRFIGAERFHHVWDTCRTFQDALLGCDPFGEYIWGANTGPDHASNQNQ